MEPPDVPFAGETSGGVVLCSDTCGVVVVLEEAA